MRVGVVHLPGAQMDETTRAVQLAGGQPVPLWHASEDLGNVDALIIPSGRAYGNYLRPGALAATAPLLRTAAGAARKGLPVLGLGTGFAALCEMGLLPGALVANESLRFDGAPARFDVSGAPTSWTSTYIGAEEPLTLPVNVCAGQYVADAATLDRLETNDRVVLRWAGRNRAGSARGIAGITNGTGTVVGILPAAQNAVEEGYGPSVDGIGFFTSMGAFAGAQVGA